jgi:hypothetical protein
MPAHRSGDAAEPVRRRRALFLSAGGVHRLDDPDLQQTALRHEALSLAVVVVGFGAVYLFHVKPASIHYKDTAWPATAACLKTGSVCQSGLNPYIIGSVYVPSDQQLRDMTLNQRRSFQQTARIP